MSNLNLLSQYELFHFPTDSASQKEKATSSAPKPNDENIIRSQKVSEGLPSSVTAGVDSTQQQQPIPSPRKSIDAPDVSRTPSSKTSDSQELGGPKMLKAPRSSDIVEDANSSSPSLFTSEKTSSEMISKGDLGEVPSFIVPVKRATNKKAKVVDVDVDKLYKYRPQSLDEPDIYQYRPGFNENQHCNVDEYRIESLSENIDLYRPSAIDACEGINYRASSLEKPENASIHRATLHEEPSKDNYRLEDMKPETLSYRTSATLASDLLAEEQEESQQRESIPEVREKPEWKNLIEIQELIKEIESAERKLIREQLAKERQFSVSDKLSSTSTNDEALPLRTSSNIDFDYLENTPKRESLATRISSMDLESKKSLRSEEDSKFSLSGKLLELFTKPWLAFRRERSPSTEPLIKRSSEDSSDIFSQANMNSLISRIKEQKLQRARYEEFQEFKSHLELPISKPKNLRQKNVSFAPSSQVKYIIPSSESQSEESGVSPSSSTSNEALFKTQIPTTVDNTESPPTSDESDESTLFKKSNEQSNNSTMQKFKARKIYDGLVKKFRNRSLNNSIILPERREVRNMDITNSEEESSKREGYRSEFSNVTSDKSDFSIQSSQEIDSTFISHPSGPMFKNTILKELPVDENEKKNPKENTVGGPFYKFEKNERLLIQKRRKFLWSSSSSSDQSNFNSNNSKFYNGFSLKFKPLNKNLLR